ncbi:MAG: MFS transporter [Firmicutes bacterium]|nr:MFS transporter [Bacillota bacterium]
MLTAQGARESFYPLFALSIGFDEVAIGVLMSVHALSSIVVQPFAGSLAATWGRPRMLSLAMLCGFLGSMAVPLMRSFVPLAAATALAGVALGANQPSSMACVAEAAPKELRGVAMALRLTGNRLALLLSPIIAGGLATVWGLPAYFYGAAGMLIGGSALMAGVARATPARGATVGVDAPPADTGPGGR